MRCAHNFCVISERNGSSYGEESGHVVLRNFYLGILNRKNKVTYMQR